MILVPFRVFLNSYSPLTCSFKSLCSRMRFVVEVVTIGGGLPDFLAASYPSSAFSAPAVSVSVSVVLRGAKKLRVNTAFRGSLTAADVGTGLVDFLVVCKVSSEMCILRVFSSWKWLSWAADSTEVLFTARLCPAYALTLRMAFSWSNVTAYMPQRALKGSYRSRVLQILLCSPPRYAQYRSIKSNYTTTVAT
jgi:hypothetical protein